MDQDPRPWRDAVVDQGVGQTVHPFRQDAIRQGLAAKPNRGSILEAACQMPIKQLLCHVEMLGIAKLEAGFSARLMSDIAEDPFRQRIVNDAHR
jgi:hypothetical protein